MLYEISDRQLLDIRKAAGPRADFIMRVINGCRVEEKPKPKPKAAKQGE